MIREREPVREASWNTQVLSATVLETIGQDYSSSTAGGSDQGVSSPSQKLSDAESNVTYAILLVGW